MNLRNFFKRYGKKEDILVDIGYKQGVWEYSINFPRGAGDGNHNYWEDSDSKAEIKTICLTTLQDIIDSCQQAIDDIKATR